MSSSTFAPRKLVLQGIPQSWTKTQICQVFFKDFEDLNIFVPINTINSRTKLVFVDFPFHWAAKVARRLVNLLQHETSPGNFVTADFAKCSDSQFDKKLPSLLTRQAVSQSEEEFVEEDKCTSCSKSDTELLVCSTCATGYSSTKYCDRRCQARDWSVHKREECRPLPKLVRPEDLNLEVKQKTKFVVPYIDEFPETVKITHVQSHKVIYVRPANQKFEDLMASIGNLKNSCKLTETPEVDDTVLAPFGNTYHRAQIMDVNDENIVQAFFVDLGSSAPFHWQHLRKLTFKGRSLPRQTFKVILEDGNGTTPSNSQQFQKYLESLYLMQSELKVARTSTRDQHRYITLQELHGGKIVNDFQGNTQSIDNDTRVFFDDNQITRLKPGTCVKVKVMETNWDVPEKADIVSVMALNSFAKFWKIDRQINEFANISSTHEVYEPLPYEICIAKIGERWLRIIVLEVRVDIVSLRLLDIGINPVEIPRSNFHPMRIPRELSFDFFTDVCRIENWHDSKLKAARSKIKTNGTLVVDSVTFDQEDSVTKLAFNFLDHQ